MVRRGWTHVEVPSGWVQVLRGPRPPSVQWPSAKGVSNSKFQERRSSAAPPVGKGSGNGAPRHKERDVTPLPRRTPEMNRKAAVAKIARIQASIAVLGDDDPEEVEVLQRALEQQRHRSLRPFSSSSARKNDCRERTRKYGSRGHPGSGRGRGTCGASESPVSTASHHVTFSDLNARCSDGSGSKEVLKLYNCKPKFRTLPLRPGRRGVVAHFPASPTRSFLARCLHGWKSATL